MGQVGDGFTRMATTVRSCTTLDHMLCWARRCLFLMMWRREQHILGGDRVCHSDDENNLPWNFNYLSFPGSTTRPSGKIPEQHMSGVEPHN